MEHEDFNALTEANAPAQDHYEASPAGEEYEYHEVVEEELFVKVVSKSLINPSGANTLTERLVTLNRNALFIFKSMTGEDGKNYRVDIVAVELSSLISEGDSAADN